MNKFSPALTAAMLALLLTLQAVPAFAANHTKLKGNLEVTGNLTVDGTQTTTGAQTFTGNAAVGGNLAVTGTSVLTGAQTLTGNTTMSGNATVAGTLGVTGAVTLTSPLTAANIQTGSAKRQLLKAMLSPETGAAADSTTYASLIAFGRAGIVKRITYICAVPPTVGTDTIEVLKNNTTTLISAATFDANTLVAYTATNATLTATTSDLTLAATDSIRCKYNAGAQTTDAQDVEVIIEFEPTDF